MLWGYSSAGRAPALHAGGLRFDPAWLHHSKEARVIMQVENTALSLCLLVEDCSLKNWKADKVQSRQTSVLEKLGVKPVNWS